MEEPTQTSLRSKPQERAPRPCRPIPPHVLPPQGWVLSRAPTSLAPSHNAWHLSSFLQHPDTLCLGSFQPLSTAGSKHLRKGNHKAITHLNGGRYSIPPRLVSPREPTAHQGCSWGDSDMLNAGDVGLGLSPLSFTELKRDLTSLGLLHDSFG